MPLRDLIELKIFWVPTAKVHVWVDTHPSNVKAVKDNPRLEPGHCKHSNKEYVSHTGAGFEPRSSDRQFGYEPSPP